MYNTFERDYILCMTSRFFCRSFTNVTLLCFVSHSNDMTSWQSSSTENVLCNVTPFFYHHIVVIQHLVWSDRRLSVISKENVHNVKKNHVLISFKGYNCIMLLSFIKDIFLFNKIPLQHQIYSLSVHDIHSKSKKKPYIIKGSK